GDRGAQLRCLTAIFNFSDGIGRTRSFVADTGAAVVVGGGDINLRNETINMVFEPSAKDVSLAAVAVPVRVKGPLANPNVGPDPVGVATKVPRTALSLADAALGLVGADELFGGAPAGSCKAVGAGTADAAKPAKKKKSSTT